MCYSENVVKDEFNTYVCRDEVTEQIIINLSDGTSNTDNSNTENNE